MLCEATLEASGQVELIAQAKDAQGHVARAASSVWVTRAGEVWFGSANDDRMDVLPEQRAYEPGQVAKFQVRSPFRHATALLAVERNGIIETRTVELDGRDPTIELPVKAEWAPNVFVSVLAVRGRVREVPWYSLFTWGWKSPVEWWHAWRDEGQEYQAPTAMVDLAKPAFKFGITEIEVGSAGHRLKVEVVPDKATYPIRATSQVRIKVTLPDGRTAPAGTEVTLAAVDEALLTLKPNDSWNLFDAMIKRRDYAVETATAQMQIIGKRHFGKKAAPAGGGGGQFPTRELFDTLLLWNPSVVLDAKGEAVVQVPLNDSLTSFRIVAIADVVQGAQSALFGNGQATIAATQDLQIVSGVPPLVREGDRYKAMFTLRNTTKSAMSASLAASAGEQSLPAQTVAIAAGAAVDVAWDVDVPFNVASLAWTVAADAGAAHDRMKFAQKVAEAVPITVRQATLMQLDKTVRIPIAPPVDALPDASGKLRGGIDVALQPKLGDGLPGVRDFFRRYPWSCFEQQTSISVGLRDTAHWHALVNQLSLYQDEDGLVNYFPPSRPHTGSDSLTAYVLSISDEATKLGYDFALPDEAKASLERGLIGFVEGKVNRDFWRPAFLKNGDLDVRKLAAIEALSRYGKAQPRMLDSIQILPNQWPTGAVIDWLQILDRVGMIPSIAPSAWPRPTQVLRARLNVQGTRLGFSTERDDSWWWLMSNSRRQQRAPDAGRAGPQGLGRRRATHRHGHAAAPAVRPLVDDRRQRVGQRRDGGVLEEVRDGARARQRRKCQHRADRARRRRSTGPRTPAGATLPLGWPAGFGVNGNKADANAAGRPRRHRQALGHADVEAPRCPSPTPFGSGYRITKTITPVEQKVKGSWSRGDVVRVHIDIDVQADATWVVVNDPIPGGASMLGTGLGNDDQINTSAETDDSRGWLAYQERTFEAFRAYYRYLPKGAFSVEYTMRLNNPGRFGLPQTRIEAMYAPEMFGEFAQRGVHGGRRDLAPRHACSSSLAAAWPRLRHWARTRRTRVVRAGARRLPAARRRCCWIATASPCRWCAPTRDARRGAWVALAQVSPALAGGGHRVGGPALFATLAASTGQPSRGAAVGRANAGGTRGASTITMQLAGLLDADLALPKGGRSVGMKIEPGRRGAAHRAHVEQGPDPGGLAQPGAVPRRAGGRGGDVAGRVREGAVGPQRRGVGHRRGACCARPTRRRRVVGQRACGVLKAHGPRGRLRHGAGLRRADAGPGDAARSVDLGEQLAPHFARQVLKTNARRRRRPPRCARRSTPAPSAAPATRCASSWPSCATATWRTAL